ncbi:MAG: hypothetical protein ACOC0P_06510, partial [Planctomycetota bacterium]
MEPGSLRLTMWSEMMELPVVDPDSSLPTEQVVRAIKRAIDVMSTTGSAEVEPLDCGTIYVNPDRPDVYDANFVADVHIDDGMTPDHVYEEVTKEFRERGATCHTWHSRSEIFPEGLAAFLEERGHARETNLIMRLIDYRPPRHRRDDLQIVNARAVRQ